MRTRQPKRLPVAVDESLSKKSNNNNSEDAASDAGSEEQQPPLPERKRARKQHAKNKARILDGYKEGVVIKDVEIEKRMDFCCCTCTCSEEQRGRIHWDDQYVHSSDDSLWHRRCCHNLVDPPPEDWLSPFDQAILDAEPTEENYHLMDQKMTDEKRVDMGDLREKYWTAKRHESEMYNEDEMEGMSRHVI